MKKTALLIDGGWFAKGLGDILRLPGGWPTAEQVRKNAVAALEPAEDLFRIFYYDSDPCDQTVFNPIDGSKLDFKSTRGFAARRQFLFELGQLPFLALRRGEAVARGWEFTDAYKTLLMKGGSPAPPQPRDVFPSIQQKGVDMRIGMDVATLALKKLVERIGAIARDRQADFFLVAGDVFDSHIVSQSVIAEACTKLGQLRDSQRNCCHWGM